MGNLICCAGENHNKRGGTNVKTLLRKTEKPGKRRRIDDLVRDVLKKEQREDRQNRIREKKETNRPSQEEHGNASQTGVNESSEEKNEENGTIVNKDGGKEENPKKSLDVASSNSGVSLEESFKYKSEAQNQLVDQSSISDVSEMSEKQPDDCASLLSVHSISDTESKPESDAQQNCERESSGDDAHNDESEDSRTRDCNQAGIGSEVGEVRKILPDDNKVVDASEAEVKAYAEGNTPLNDIEIEYAVQIEAKNSKENTMSEEQKVVIASIYAATAEEDTPTDKQPDNESESCTESTRSDEVAITAETDEPNHDNQLQKDQDVSNCDEYAEPESDGLKCENADKLSDSSDESEWDLNEVYEDLIAEIPDGSCEHNNEQHEEDNIRLSKEDNQNDDYSTTDIRSVHDADNLLKRNEEVAVTNKLGVPEVHDTHSESGYDTTELRHNIENGKESFRSREELALKYIPRAIPMTSKLLESSTYLENTKKFPSISEFNNAGSFRNQINKLGQNKIDLLPNARSDVYNNKITLQKKLLGQSVTKYGGMDSMMIGGQRPQLREIQRLKQDSFDFPPKFRQHTEQDKRGSIADLKWSRHMKPKVRKNKRMSKFELEEISRGRHHGHRVETGTKF